MVPFQTPKLVPVTTQVVQINEAQFTQDVYDCRQYADAHNYTLWFRVETDDEPHTRDVETGDADRALAEYCQRIADRKLQTCLYAEYYPKEYESDTLPSDTDCLIDAPEQTEH